VASLEAAYFAALALVVGFLAWEGGFFAVVLALEDIDSVDKMLWLVETALKWHRIRQQSDYRYNFEIGDGRGGLRLDCP
jgi:hypothetical protein